MAALLSRNRKQPKENTRASCNDRQEIYPVCIEQCFKRGIIEQHSKHLLQRESKLETQLNAIVGRVKTYYDQNKQKYPKVHIIFEKPLPNRIVYEGGAIYEEKDGIFELMKEAAE